MINRFLAWLKSIYYTAPTAEPNTPGGIMSEPSVDTSAQTQPVSLAAAADNTLQPAVTVSALNKAKADFEAFVAFVEHGITVLGADAEDELVALKDKYL